MEQYLKQILETMQIPNHEFSGTSDTTIQFINLGINSLHNAIEYVCNLPYAQLGPKLAELVDYTKVLPEKCGTCSAKNALIVTLGNDIGIPFVLGSAIYPLTTETFPELKNILKKYNMPYIPESHNFIIFNNKFLDITFPYKAKIIPKNALQQISAIKVDELLYTKSVWYPKFLAEWMQKHNLKVSFPEFVKINAEVADIFGKTYNKI